MQRLTRDPANYGYVFDPAVPPRLTVALGESFVVETEDAFSGALFEEGVLPTEEQLPHLLAPVPPRVNPVTGPVYVEGVERGDLLAVTLERIEPAPTGVHAIVEGWEPGTSWRDWPLFSGSRKYTVEHRPGATGTTRDGSIGVGAYAGPMMPIVGTIGVAPDYVAESTIWQSPHGGVWNHRHVCEGATISFNAYHDGGLLSLGDMHGVQGDCEFFGIADETRGEVQIRCEVVKGKQIPYPRIEHEDRLIQMYCYRPLELAVRRATKLLLEWVREDFDMSQQDAYWLVALNPDFRITLGNMLHIDRIEYTVSAEISRASLGRVRGGITAHRPRGVDGRARGS
jgi:acetamidase/formamidase